MKVKNISFLLSAVIAVSFFSFNFTSCSTTKKETVSENKGVLRQPVAQEKPAQVFNGRNNDVVKDDRVPEVSYITPQADSVVEITINLVGDLMCHMPQATNSKTATGYDFNPSFEFVKDYLNNADITMGNLELTTAGSRVPLSGYPAFNAPDEYIPALKDNGFDFLVTSNNHSMDTGEEGLLRTIEQVKKNNLGYTGTFISQKDHDSIRVLNIKGIRVAVLNYTYGTNGAYPQADHKYMLNVIDSATITNEVKRARALNPDFVLVFYHYGVEYAAEPIETQRKAVEWARAAGATLLIGGHPHVVGPCKFLPPDAKHPDTAFVAWSLGNFFSNQNKRYTDAGVIVTIHLQKNFTQNTKRIAKAEFFPTWVYRGEKTENKRHIIFPAEIYSKKEKIPAYLDSSLVQKMKQAYEDTRAIINKYGPNTAQKQFKP
ncbi:MAG: CapA family protein [Bacteroidia bacterium]|nr:CapA family protein [Bacteroidia bacterium]